MQNKHVLVGASSVAVVAVTVLSVHYHHRHPHPRPPHPNPNPVASVCHIVNNVLPDPSCTPGVVNPDVNQSNINQTICVRGWTSTIRPPQSYTSALKLQSIMDYGYADTNPGSYEEDHFISLELGGNPTDPKNLWAEPGKSPNPKDHIENLLRQRVCSGQITLVEAQHEISTDWTQVK